MVSESDSVGPMCDLNSPGALLDACDYTWFSVAVIAETGDLVCISHNGNIVSIKDHQTMELEGVIDGGIGKDSRV